VLHGDYVDLVCSMGRSLKATHTSTKMGFLRASTWGALDRVAAGARPQRHRQGRSVSGVDGLPTNTEVGEQGHEFTK
jgi:hypothetical protein